MESNRGGSKGCAAEAKEVTYQTIALLDGQQRLPRCHLFEYRELGIRVTNHRRLNNGPSAHYFAVDGPAMLVNLMHPIR